MGLYQLVNTALVGLFGFGALHYCAMWWFSRREAALIAFSLQCALFAMLSASLVALAGAETIPAGQTALNARTTLSVLAIALTIWVTAEVTGYKPRSFVIPVIGMLLLVAVVSMVTPFAGTVVGLTRLHNEWAGDVTILERAAPRMWILGPAYVVVLVVPLFGLVAARSLASSDRFGGALVAVSNATILFAAVAAAFIDIAHVPWPYLGAIPQAVWVALIALLVSREYVRRGEHLLLGERRAKAMFDQTFQLMGLTAPDGTIVDVNRTALAFAGIPEDDALGRPIWDAPWWGHAAAPRDQMHAAVRGAAAGEIVRFESAHPRPNGEIAHLDVSVKPQRDEQGHVSLLIVEARDITERKRAEDALREFGLRHQAILESSLDGVIVIDAFGRVLEFNAASEAIFGYRREDVLQREIAELIVPPALRESHRRGLERYRTSGKGKIIGKRFETPALRADGTELRVELSIQPIAGSDPRLYAGVVRDITERLKLEEQLRQSQKMDAIGRLAGGLAHDFNNLLTVISGYSELLVQRLRDNPALHGHAKGILDAVEHAASLTNRLLAFSRRSVLAPETLDVNVVIRDAENMLRRLIGEDILLTVVLAPAGGYVKADRVHLSQVLINLAVNARDAMPNGGSLKIETRSVVVEESEARQEPPPGRYLALTVSDSGHGMTPETRARLFEPFFTTKADGKGTGLGLSVVHGIVKQSGGYINVHSQPGVGSTFQIHLPLVDEAPAMTTDAASAADFTVAGRETILLVEDEEDVRELVAIALETGGFKVLRASDAHSALALVDQCGTDIKLMVTDVIMPNVNGRDLATMARTRLPGLKVLFMSGYTDDAALRDGFFRADEPFLQKPFALHALSSKVREVLDR